MVMQSVNSTTARNTKLSLNVTGPLPGNDLRSKITLKILVINPNKPVISINVHIKMHIARPASSDPDRYTPCALHV